MNPIVKWVMQTMMKGQTGVMRTLPDKKLLDLNVNITVERLIRNNIDPSTIKTPGQLDNIIKQIEQPKVIPADSPRGKGITEALFGKKGEVINFPQKRNFKQEVDDMIKDGTITKGAAPKQSDKVKTRQMFKDSNLNKTNVDKIIADIKAMDPMDSMKEANSVIGRKGAYKNLTPEESKKILKDTEDHIFERDIPIDPEDMATGGRAGFKGGGLTESDYLKVKDMLNHWHDYKKGGGTLSKTKFANAFFRENNADGGVAGLLGERQNFSMGKRAFLKMLAGAGAGIAGLKSGLIGFGGKGAAKKAVTETVKSAGSTPPPPYFFKLVDKIKTMGDDVTSKSATTERQKVTKYKDYELTEDVTTGEQTIQRIKIDDGNPQYYDEVLAEETYMNYKPGKGQADETTGKVADEYVEDTSYLRTSGPQKGEIYDTVDGVGDDVIKEGTVFEDNMTEFGMTKKASGGIARMLGE
jgi:hypothetical protein